MDAQVTCPGCNRKLAAGARKCLYCGASIGPPPAAAKPPELVTCTKCGRNMAAHLASCQMCGTPLPRTAAQAGQAAPNVGAAAGSMDFGTAMQIAVAHLRANRLKEALPFLERGLQLQPQNAEVWSFKATCLHNLNLFAEALTCYQQSLKLRPNHAHTIFSMGNSLRLLGQLRAACECYLQASTLEPGNASFFGNLALSMRDVGRYSDAIKPAQAIVAANPMAAPFLHCLGFCLLKLGKAAEALPHLQRAAQAQPQPQHQIDLGICLEKLGRQQEADAQFECASKGDAMTPRPNLYRALLYERQKDLANAAEYFYRACTCFNIEQRLSSLTPHAEEEALQARQGLKRLRPHLARGADLDAQKLLSDAAAAEQAGNFTEALPLYEEASTLDPDNKSAQEGMLRMRAARKRR